MRALLSIAALVIVVLTVTSLVKTQLGGVARPPAQIREAPVATPAAPPAPTPRAAAEQCAAKIIGAIEAGAAARASEAER